MTTPRLLSLLWLYLIASIHSATAAPPPELTILRQQYEKVFAERVTAMHESAVAELDAKFTTALDNAVAQAKSSGDLPTVLALQADQKRLAEEQALPAEDALDTPEPLKNLRVIYREQLAKLTEQRATNTAALQAPYAARLQELEATLTKNDRVEEAKEVMDYRLGLATAIPTAPALVGIPTVPATAPTATMPAPMTARVKGDDRKAAEWVLSVGGTVRLWDSETGIIVNSIGTLPKNEFSIRSIHLNGQRNSLKPFTDAEFVVLAGLERLDQIELAGLDITATAFDTLSTCSKLRVISLQYNRFGDQVWAHLAEAPSLAELSHGYDELPVTGVGISQVAAPSLTSLFLTTAPITDEALPEIATFKKLTHLSLERTKVTDAGISALAPLKQVTGLSVKNTDVTAVGLASLKGMPLESLSYGRTMNEMVAQAAEIGRIFPKVTKLGVPVEINPTSEEWTALAAAWPKLKSLTGINSKLFTDDSSAGIAALESLEELEFFSAPRLTDQGVASLTPLKKLRALRFIYSDFNLTDTSLVTLAGMRSLKILKLPKCKGITDAGIAAFKKARPDVKVE